MWTYGMFFPPPNGLMKLVFSSRITGINVYLD